jgi:hypothetical protein
MGFVGYVKSSHKSASKLRRFVVEAEAFKRHYQWIFLF